MATYRSAHSEPYTSKSSSRLTALRKRLTTCFQQWCQQLQQLQQPASFQKCKSGPNHHFYKIFVQADCKVFGDKTKYIRQFKKIFKGNKDLAKKSEPGRVVPVPEKPVDVTEESQKKQLQLVARLFSSTLISAKEEISCSYNSSSMTIIDSNYNEVREEYPEIDSEIRSILLANAQSGVTISIIKNEYRKLTGIPFPLYENITDFLLTIPHVTAECSVSGTRIFNMKPRPETRHLYEMVVHQKRSNDLGTNDHPVAAPPPRLWRCQYKRRALSSLNTNNNSNNNNNLNQNINHIEEKVPAVGGKEVTIEAQAVPLQQLARAAAESNWCYQDNWNHLNNCYQRANIFADPPEKPPPLPAQENHHRSHNSQNHQDNLKNQLNLLVNEHHRLQQGYQYPSNKRRNDFSPTPTPTTISSGTQHDSMFTINSDYDAYLLDFPLLGDDFLLYLARMELRCRFKRSMRVLQSGLCVSGQTISGARSRLHHVQVNKGTQIIVNIGSVDIMRGRPMVQIQHDFRQLIKDMHNRGLVPILTTLAPLANYCHDKAVCDKVVKFNQFIWKECASYLKVIDIHSCLVNENGVVRFDCFQYSSRNVTGSKESYVFWNKIGRQRVLQMIEASLEY